MEASNDEDAGLLLNLPMLDVEDFVVEGGVAEYLVEVVAVGVGDEYLAEIVAGYQAHNLLYTLGIEFVEDVVQ